VKPDIYEYSTIVYVFEVTIILCWDCGLSRSNLSCCWSCEVW